MEGENRKANETRLEDCNMWTTMRAKKQSAKKESDRWLLLRRQQLQRHENPQSAA